MIDLSVELNADLRQHSVNVPDYILKSAIATGCRRFFIESGLWLSEQQLSSFSDRLVVFSDDDNAYIVDVQRVMTESGVIIDAVYRAGMLYLSRQVEGDINVTFILAPVPDSTVVPDWAFLNHKTALASAAIQALKSQQGQPWYDADGSNYHEQMYRQQLGEARIAITPSRVCFRPFA